MNPDPNNSSFVGRLVYGVAIIGAFLIAGLLVWKTREYTDAPPPNAARIAERSKALAEIRESEAKGLNNLDWADQDKGVVRLPIAEAMSLVEREWRRDPAAARSNLLERVKVATAVPPAEPVPAAPPSEFE